MNLSFREKLKEKGLKVTPQRLAIFDALIRLDNHPTAEEVGAYIRETHPNISVATVYKVLNTFAENDLIKKVKTAKDIMRYDTLVASHHHLYCSDTEKIEDFHDEKLNELINNYFIENKIKNFNIEDIQLQITGKFKK